MELGPLGVDGPQCRHHKDATLSVGVTTSMVAIRKNNVGLFLIEPSSLVM